MHLARDMPLVQHSGCKRCCVSVCVRLGSTKQTEEHLQSANGFLSYWLLLLVNVEKRKGEKKSWRPPMSELQGLIIRRTLPFSHASAFFPGNQVLTLSLSVTAQKREGINNYTNYIISQKEKNVKSLNKYD